jgi:hypothetical protein
MNRTVNAILAIVGLSIHAVLSSQATNPYAKVPDFNINGLSAPDMRLIQTLRGKGVSVLDYGLCQRNINASYDPQLNTVVICSNVTDGDISDTLRHEAIHAAQDCKAGQSNSQVSVLSPSMNPFVTGNMDEMAELITVLYAKEHHAAEWEAWHFAAISTSDEIALLVESYCD